MKTLERISLVAIMGMGMGMGTIACDPGQGSGDRSPGESSALVIDGVDLRNVDFELVSGVPVTGPNQFCGARLWTFEDQGITPLSFPQVGAYAPGNDRPDELGNANCLADQILATIHDPILSTDPPGPAPAIVPPPDVRLENIPLRDVPKVGGAFSGGLTGLRMLVPPAGAAPADPFPVYLNEPSGPITVGQWADADGLLAYSCKPDGSSVLAATFGELIPNGLYSLWGIWRTPVPGGGGIADVPAPLGGVPNVVTANKFGSATIVRELPFCPSEETADGSLLLWATLAFHSDSAIYGGIPDAGAMNVTFVEEDGTQFESPLSLMMHHEQLAFPINFTTTVGPY